MRRSLAVSRRPRRPSSREARSWKTLARWSAAQEPTASTAYNGAGHKRLGAGFCRNLTVHPGAAANLHGYIPDRLGSTVSAKDSVASPPEGGHSLGGSNESRRFAQDHTAQVLPRRGPAGAGRLLISLRTQRRLRLAMGIEGGEGRRPVDEHLERSGPRESVRLGGRRIVYNGGVHRRAQERRIGRQQ
jgi:hypothetical protein